MKWVMYRLQFNWVSVCITDQGKLYPQGKKEMCVTGT